MITSIQLASSELEDHLLGKILVKGEQEKVDHLCIKAISKYPGLGETKSYKLRIGH